MMIDTRELRIGNLALVDQVPTELDITHLMVLSGYSHPYCEIEPIELTEEWLLRFGFKKSDKYGYFLSPHKDSCSDSCFTRLCFFLEEMDFIVNSNDYDGWYVHCEHVHQLQNIHFALTGQELKLNDK